MPRYSPRGLRKRPCPDNYFDAVVGNVPFGDYAVHDPAMKHQLTRAIHDYFFAKSLEKAAARRRHGADHQPLHDGQAGRRPSAGIWPSTPTCWARSGCRTRLSRAMPERKSRPTFCSCASARPARSRRAKPGAELETIDSPDGPIAVNEYFARHPEMMLGHDEARRHACTAAREPTLEGELTPELLHQRRRMLCPQAPMSRRTKARGPPPPMLDAEAFTGIKDGAYAERDGAIVIRNGNSFETASPVRHPPPRASAA